ncbi:MAG: lipid-transfer protein [Myxococcales bacterium]|nr:MAG: lipid-transfer protein [Myxococcales bacterium]
MRDIAIVSFAQRCNQPEWREGNDIELLIDPINEALGRVGMTRQDVQFTTGGSNDFLAGQAFSFVRALDAVGVHPVRDDSHVEMDGAWALYEAWVNLQLGHADNALIWGLGKTSLGKIEELAMLSLDPYYVAPLGADPNSVAAIQARALIESGRCTERDLAEIAAARQESAVKNDKIELDAAKTVDEIMSEPYVASPLRTSTAGRATDGAAVVILAAGDEARRLCERPAWIRGIDHRTDAHPLGVRDLTVCPSARQAADRAGALGTDVDLAELHSVHAHEELVLRDALGLGDGVSINPSGGPMLANSVMATGLIRMGEAAQPILDGQAKRAVAHASHGPCLQSNMVALLEGES